MLKIHEKHEFLGEIDHFAAAIELYVTRPHLVDKRLSGAIILGKSITSEKPKDVKEFGDIDNNEQYFAGETSQFSTILKRKLLWKRGQGSSDQDFVIWTHSESDKASVRILPVDENQGYEIQADVSNRVIEIFCGNKAPKSWLSNILIKKILRWCDEKITSPNASSLRLIPLDSYLKLYAELKARHFDTILSAWDSESTNAEKFIHEDLGIATYLLCLWREKSEQVPKSFVDLGCGNGLLVYLLSQEGITGGVGLDIRKRKIWNFFRSKGTDLRVETIHAKADDYFKNYDWLIGNHSDELTPWIPIMAHLSNAHYFVLPCCPFDLFGKYQRSCQKKSQYRDYLDRIDEIGRKCGYKVEEDKLRIPSTKRICFVGMKKSEPIDSDLLQALQNQEFKARPSEEIVKNCTKVPKTVTTEIIDLIVKSLLNEENYYIQENLRWNAGKSLALSEISSQVLNPQLLKELKNECGGLQTLLRNHNHIFIVMDKGFVRLRNPAQDDHSLGKKRPNAQAVNKWKKTKPCWFDQNHPQGCPSNDCFWIHS